MSDEVDANNVVAFPSREEPHQHGRAWCVGCKTEWIAVAPVGTTVLECPHCALSKGFFVNYCEPTTVNVWECRCGNRLFMVTETPTVFCVNCGTEQRF